RCSATEGEHTPGHPVYCPSQGSQALLRDMTLLRCIPFVLAAAVSPSPARAQPDSDPIKVRTVAEELERERAFDAARRQVDLWRHNAGGWEARGRECTLWEREGLLELALLCFEE